MVTLQSTRSNPNPDPHTIGRLGRPRLQVPASPGRMKGLVIGMNGRAPSGSYGRVRFRSA